jgi:glycine hydroxymethyltransferase
MSETQPTDGAGRAGGPQAVFDAPLDEVDPEIAELIGAELGRQRATLDLVASESVPPRAVLEVQGSVLSAKYADGYAGRRDYDTCHVVDEIELLAIDRAKELFGAGHANVQPYSGSNANFCVLHALCEPGDVVLGFDFSHGGHPTHNDSATFSGRYFDAIGYHVRRDDRLVDMDEVAELARAHRPKVIFAGWSCYPRFLDFRQFRQICDEVGAYLVVDMAHFAGLVAAGLHPDPVGYADVCTMTVHKTLGGARGGAILSTEALAEQIDAGVYPGEQGCPLMHVIAAKAVTFAVASTEAYRERMERTVEGARAIAAALVEAEPRTGATVVTGGTDVHQLLVDLSGGAAGHGEGSPPHVKGAAAGGGAAGGGAAGGGAAGGPPAASSSWSEPGSPSGAGRQAWAELHRLNEVGISANAIRLAFDPLPEPGASGLRFGATALASRGFGPAEFAEVGAILADALAVRDGPGSPSAAASCVERVRALTEAFPLYGFLDEARGRPGR